MKKTILSTLCFLLVSCFMFFADAGTRIVVLGSSTAAGAGVSDSNRAWVNQYRTYLQSIDPTNTVTNLAKGGYSTSPMYCIMIYFLPNRGKDKRLSRNLVGIDLNFNE